MFVYCFISLYLDLWIVIPLSPEFGEMRIFVLLGLLGCLCDASEQNVVVRYQVKMFIFIYRYTWQKSIQKCVCFRIMSPLMCQSSIVFLHNYQMMTFWMEAVVVIWTYICKEKQQWFYFLKWLKAELVLELAPGISFSLLHFTWIVRRLTWIFLWICTYSVWHSSLGGELVCKVVVVLLWELSPTQVNSGSICSKRSFKITGPLCLMFVFC